MNDAQRDSETPAPNRPDVTVPIESKVLLTTAEAAALLSISERMLWTMSDAGDIPVVRIGKTAKRYRRASLEAWAERTEALQNRTESDCLVATDEELG
jgi:excisionase family DNA binding protein